jgi:SAM-dependent methyltransferase
MTNNIFVFDRNIVRQNRNRCAPKLKDHGFLIDWSINQISNRLEEVKRTFPTALQIGCRSHKFQPQNFGIENLYALDIADKLNPTIQADEELLPFAAESFDLIFSPLNLHTINDLPGTLAQIKTALKPDGLFIAALFGGETLYELRDSMNAVEMEINSGISPHIAPFADMPQMGSLMQRAGFNLPVIDSEKITVTYDNALKLMEDIRYMGEGNALIERKKKLSTTNYFKQVVKDYADKYSIDDGRIRATFEIIFLIGWAPHESQQKPLRPGSAQNRLADILQSKEITL